MYVGNLSYDATDSDLRELFEAHGTVSDVFIVKDRESDRPRGFAFVSMETPEEMNAAIEGLNGAEFAGRALTINEARPREERPQGGWRWRWLRWRWRRWRRRLQPWRRSWW